MRVPRAAGFNDTSHCRATCIPPLPLPLASTLDFSFSPSDRAAPLQPRTTAIIPFTFPSSTRKPANIPLHSLDSASGRRRPSSSEDEFDEKDGDRQRLTRRSGSFEEDDAGSDFSLWSDTGDLVDQLAAEEDPLAIRLRRSFEEHQSPHRRGRSQQKRVRYAANTHGHEHEEKQAGGVKRKEDIRIPSPPPRKLWWAQKLLAAVMAPNDGHSRMHGLHGKKLIYFLSIFVSLGVFLFGVSLYLSTPTA